MFAGRHFRDEFFDDDVAHGTGSQAEEIGQDRYDEGRQGNGQGRPDGFDDARQDAAEKGFVLSDAGCLEGHGDDGPFGQILQGDAQRQGQGTGGADARLPG